MTRSPTLRWIAVAGTVASGLVPLAGVAEAQMPPTPASRWDPEAAAAYLDTRQAWWRAWPAAARDHETSCVSCHTSVPYALARPALRSLLGEVGPTAPEADLLHDVRKRVELWREVEPFYSDERSGPAKTSESRGTETVLNALILADRDARQGRLTPETRQALDHLWALQSTRGDDAGAWAWLFFGLAPWESEGAGYFGAALAAVAVGVAPDDYRSSPGIQERLSLLRSYLLKGWQSRSVLDRVMLLWAATELGDLVTPDEQERIVRDVMRQRNADGAWSLAALGSWERQDGTPRDPRSDGYATGLIAYVLQRSGVSPTDGNMRRALEWLAESQDPTTGRWPASSLNKERDPASDRGLFMSDAATAFAVLALTQAGSGR